MNIAQQSEDISNQLLRCGYRELQVLMPHTDHLVRSWVNDLYPIVVIEQSLGRLLHRLPDKAQHRIAQLRNSPAFSLDIRLQRTARPYDSTVRLRQCPVSSYGFHVTAVQVAKAYRYMNLIAAISSRNGPALPSASRKPS